jgi:predicted Zn finger-like uncharacterized protein
VHVACPTCHAEYNIDERRVPPGGLNVRCSKCRNAFPVRPGPETAAVPLPDLAGPPAAARIPLPPPEAPPGPTLSFPSPFATPPPLPAFDEAPQPRATLQFRPPFAGAAEPPEPPPAAAPSPAPLGFGEVELDGGGAAPVLGYGDEPFPFEMPGAPGGEPPLADPFAAESEPLAAPPSPPLPVSAPAPARSEERASRPPGLGALGPKETEELEALFDDPAAKKAAQGSSAKPAAGPRAGAYRIRRRSGKVFGPFPEGEIVEMLSRRELLGNEEVAADGAESFGAIGTVPAFAAALRALAGTPVPVAASPAPPLVSPAGRPRGVPRRRADLLARVRARLSRAGAWIVVPAAVLAVVLAAGAGAAATPYGLFFHRAFTGKKVDPDRPGAKLLAEARQRLGDDDAGALAKAVELADGALRLDSRDREARGRDR